MSSIELKSLEHILLKTPDTVAGIYVDGIVDQTSESGMNITQNPLPTGAVLSDHAVTNNRIITMNVVITKITLQNLTNFFLDNKIIAEFSTDVSKMASIHNSFLELQKKQDFIELVTETTRYKNCLLINIVEFIDTKEVSFITLTFEQAQVVTTLSTADELPTSLDEIQNLQMSPTSDFGTVATLTPTRRVLGLLGLQ